MAKDHNVNYEVPDPMRVLGRQLGDCTQTRRFLERFVKRNDSRPDTTSVTITIGEWIVSVPLSDIRAAVERLKCIP